MRLFIANCTQQYAVLSFRVIEASNPFSQPIEAGQQAMVGGRDMSMPQIDGIIKHLQLYGLFVVDEVGAIDRSRRIVWLASIDKPVTDSKIRQAMLHNETVLFDQGKTFREKAAVAVSRNMSERTPHAAQNIEMTIQENTPGSVGPTGAPAVAEGYFVNTTTDKAVVNTGRRPRRARG